jgi:hypothetical protein
VERVGAVVRARAVSVTLAALALATLAFTESAASSVAGARATPLVKHVSYLTMRAGDKAVTVPANSVVSGDITINRKKYCDDDPRSGLVFIFDSPAKVAPVPGAQIYVNLRLKKKNVDPTANSFANDARNNAGCLDKCDKVDILRYPTDGPQGSGS